MSKYCIRLDRPMEGLTISDKSPLPGCNIYGVHHDCEKCPNLIEMGDNVTYSASEHKEPYEL